MTHWLAWLWRLRRPTICFPQAGAQESQWWNLIWVQSQRRWDVPTQVDRQEAKKGRIPPPSFSCSYLGPHQGGWCSSALGRAVCFPHAYLIWKHPHRHTQKSGLKMFHLGTLQPIKCNHGLTKTNHHSISGELLRDWYFLQVWCHHGHIWFGRGMIL